METSRKFIMAELSIRKLWSSSVLIMLALMKIWALLALMKIRLWGCGCFHNVKLLSTVYSIHLMYRDYLRLSLITTPRSTRSAILLFIWWTWSTIVTCSALLAERLRLDYHYRYHYLNPFFSQSDELGLSNWPIRFLENRDKVAVVIVEVKSQPL